MWTKGAFGKNVLENTFVLNVLEIIRHSNVQGYLSQVNIQFTHSLPSTNSVYQVSPDTVTVCYLPIQNLCWPQLTSANTVYQVSPDTITVC